MQWPARISGGRIYRQPVISLDIVPTVLAAAGLPADVPGLDGGNLLPFVEGATTGTPHAVLLRLNINMEYPGAEGLVR
jgi:arylsulfatase A-like enzyme